MEVSRGGIAYYCCPWKEEHSKHCNGFHRRAVLLTSHRNLSRLLSNVLSDAIALLHEIIELNPCRASHETFDRKEALPTTFNCMSILVNSR